MTLAERILEESKDKNKEYLVKKSIPALTNFITGLNETEASKFYIYLENFLNKGNNVDLDSFNAMAPLIFLTNHNFDIANVKNIIQKYDKKAVNPRVLEADLYLFSILFDLYYADTFDNALENASQLSKDFFERNFNFKEILKSGKFEIFDDELKNLFTILFQYQNSINSQNPIVLFLKGLTFEKDCKRELNNTNESIKKFILFCLSKL